MAAGLQSVVKLLTKGAAKQSAPIAERNLKRVMYTNQERSGQIGGSFKPIEGFDPELKRPIVGDDITNLNSSYIEIESPAGAVLRKDAKLMVDPNVASDIPVGNSIKGSVTVKANLIDSGNGARWSWTKAPEGYQDNGFIVSAQGPSKFTPQGEGRAYALKTIYEKGGNLSGYDKRKSEFKNMSLEETEAILMEKLKTAKGKERSKIRDQLRGQPPHGRPTTTGVPEFGPIVGEIQMGKKGKKHPVYEYIVMRKKGGKIGSVVERNPYNYEPKGI